MLGIGQLASSVGIFAFPGPFTLQLTLLAWCDARTQAHMGKHQPQYTILISCNINTYIITTAGLLGQFATTRRGPYISIVT